MTSDWNFRQVTLFTGAVSKTSVFDVNLYYRWSNPTTYHPEENGSQLKNAPAPPQLPGNFVFWSP